MPTDVKILGFTNKWYKPGISKAETLDVFGTKIKAFSLAYLIASKLEAFKGRGKANFMASSDIEDIITLIDGRSQVANDLLSAPADVRSELKKEFNTLIKNQNFLDAIDAHISDRANLEGRKRIILSRIKDFLAQAK